jgi:hypothetical protein
MRSGRAPLAIVAIGIAAVLVATASPAVAVDPSPAPSRAELAAQIHAKYDPLFASEALRLGALAKKATLDDQFNRQYKAVLLDFNTMRATVMDGLASDTQDIEAMGQLADEETGEFNTSIYNLEQMALKIKTITCVKGKTSKKITGISVVCPKGYTKKK